MGISYEYRVQPPSGGLGGALRVVDKLLLRGRPWNCLASFRTRTFPHLMRAGAILSAAGFRPGYGDERRFRFSHRRSLEKRLAPLDAYLRESPRLVRTNIELVGQLRTPESQRLPFEVDLWKNPSLAWGVAIGLPWLGVERPQGAVRQAFYETIFAALGLPASSLLVNGRVTIQPRAPSEVLPGGTDDGGHYNFRLNFPEAADAIAFFQRARNLADGPSSLRMALSGPEWVARGASSLGILPFAPGGVFAQESSVLLPTASVRRLDALASRFRISWGMRGEGETGSYSYSVDLEKRGRRHGIKLSLDHGPSFRERKGPAWFREHWGISVRFHAIV